MVLPPISGTVQRFSYTRWLTSWRTFQSLHGVGSSHWSSPTARTRASNSSTALRCSAAWSAGMLAPLLWVPRGDYRGGCTRLAPLSMWGELASPTAPQERLCHGRGRAFCPPLFVAQGHDRLHAGRLAGRPDAEEH